MTTISLVQNGGTWPWSSSVTSVSYRSGSTTAGWEEYLLYDDTSNTVISSGGIHAIQTNANDWKDQGSSAPVYLSITNSTSVPTSGGVSGSTAVTASSTDKYLHLWTATGLYMGYMDVWTPFQSFGSGSGSGSGSGGSSVGYPPPRTSRWLSGVGIAIGWAWNTYQLYGAASGGNPIGGPGGGGWVADFVAGNLVHEATAEIEVGANNPDGGNVSSGDELYITFDDEHDDVSENPNMTITTEVVDEDGNTVNPSNTVDNTVVAGNTGTTTIVKIQCARKPKGKIKVYIKEPDPNNEGIADTIVSETELPRHAKGGNFW